MTNKIKLFESKNIRTHWNESQEQWLFSIVDVVAVLAEQDNYQGARNYWKVLKHRLSQEGNQTVTICNQLKMQAADGKMRLTDVADTAQLLRLIQSIPSAETDSEVNIIISPCVKTLTKRAFQKKSYFSFLV